MTWTLVGSDINTFFKCIVEVNRNAVLRVEPGKLYCRTMSVCGTIYGMFETAANVEGNGITALDIYKIVSVLDSSETTMTYKDRLLVVKRGRSRFKIPELAPNVIKEPGVISVALPLTIQDVQTKDIHDALKSVANYYNTETSIPSIRVILANNTLTLQDQDKNVDVEIDGKCMDGNVDIVISFDLIQPLISTLKNISPSIDINVNDDKSPLCIIGKGEVMSIKYYIAPRVIV